MSRVNTTGWKRKSRGLNRAIAKDFPLIVQKQRDFLHKKVTANLSGPGVHPNIPGSENAAIGKMPIPRRTGQLARALSSKRFSSVLYALWMNGAIAPYYKWVHDGHKLKRNGKVIGIIQPRRYMQDPVTVFKNKMESAMNKAIRSIIRKHGR